MDGDGAVTMETILAASTEFSSELPVREAWGDQRNQIKDGIVVHRSHLNPAGTSSFHHDARACLSGVDINL